MSNKRHIKLHASGLHKVRVYFNGKLVLQRITSSSGGVGDIKVPEKQPICLVIFITLFYPNFGMYTSTGTHFTLFNYVYDQNFTIGHYNKINTCIHIHNPSKTNSFCLVKSEANICFEYLLHPPS